MRLLCPYVDDLEQLGRPPLDLDNTHLVEAVPIAG